MTYDRKDIMTRAWQYARQDLWSRRLPASALLSLFPDALRSAWRAAKVKLATQKARAALASRPAAELRAAINDLENRDRMDPASIDQIGQLRAALGQAIAREAAEAQEADFAAKRALIASAGGRFCAVTFTKKDGTERTMQIQPATLQHHIKGDAATEAGKKAVATRKERHPHLLPVWDAKAKAPRSVNLATVTAIRINGTSHEYRTC